MAQKPVCNARTAEYSEMVKLYRFALNIIPGIASLKIILEKVVQQQKTCPFSVVKDLI